MQDVGNIALLVPNTNLLLGTNPAIIVTEMMEPITLITGVTSLTLRFVQQPLVDRTRQAPIDEGWITCSRNFVVVHSSISMSNV